jgi:hypothetical protein
MVLYGILFISLNAGEFLRIRKLFNIGKNLW